MAARVSQGPGVGEHSRVLQSFPGRLALGHVGSRDGASAGVGSQAGAGWILDGSCRHWHCAQWGSSHPAPRSTNFTRRAAVSVAGLGVGRHRRCGLLASVVLFPYSRARGMEGVVTPVSCLCSDGNWSRHGPRPGSRPLAPLRCPRFCRAGCRSGALIRRRGCCVWYCSSR